MSEPEWLRLPRTSWCMVEGTQVGPDHRRCPGPHRPVAILVSKDEYPEMRRVSA